MRAAYPESLPGLPAGLPGLPGLRRHSVALLFLFTLSKFLNL